MKKILASLAGLLVSAPVFAAADSEVLSAASTTVTTIKDNFFGVLTDNIDTISVIAAAIVGITVIWKLLRRFLGR